MPWSLESDLKATGSAASPEETLSTFDVESHALFAALAGVVFVLHENGRYVKVISTDPRLHNPAANFIGKTVHEVLPFEEASFFLNHVHRALKEGRPHRVEYCVQVEADEVWFEGSVSPVSKDATLWIARDITARKRAEEQLRHQLQITQAITASLGEGVCGFDPQGRVTFMNPAAEAALGWTESELRGRDMHAAIHFQNADGTRKPAGECPLLNVLKHGKTAKIASDVFTRKDGTMFPVSYTSSPITGDGRITGAVLAFQDVTEQQALEEQLRQAQKMEAVGQLAGGVAHDFNNLLTIINGYATLLLRKSCPGEVNHEQLREIRNAGERAAALTQRLLAFSRRQTLQPRIVRLNNVIAGIEPMLRRLIPENIHLTVRLRPETGRVKADPADLEQVIVNLAINARDAMPNGGELTIETANVELNGTESHGGFPVTPEAHALLIVADTGIGMTEGTKARIFEPFFTTKDAGRGTGLGLPIVHRIVLQSGGQIVVHSEPGAGSSFNIYLPHAAAEEACAVDSVYQDLYPGGEEAVLVAEDDEGVRTYVTSLLKDHGYAVTAVSNGNEALEYLASLNNPIDLLITDVVMPGASGPEVVRSLASQRAQIKVLCMSGYAGDATLRGGRPRRGIAFLQKPFTPEMLTRAVREMLDLDAEA